MTDQTVPAPQVIVTPSTPLLPSTTPADALVMAAYTLATTTATEMRLHREDCKARDERSQQVLSEIKTAYNSITADLNSLKLKLAFIVGGIVVIGKAVDVAASFLKHGVGS